MKILVPIKRVVDYNVKIRVKADETGVETANVKMSMNPFDEIAVEAALQLKESGKATEVVVVSIGNDGAVETLRAGLAMGADRALHVKTDAIIQPLAAARLLQAIAAQESPQLIITGKQAIDDDANQTGQMLAALMNIGQATCASVITVDGSQVTVARETDTGEITVALPLPCVITTDLRLNTPRYASLPNIMKARSKPLQVMDAATLGVDITPTLTVIKVTEPPKRKGGIKVPDVATLVDKLKNEAKVVS